MRAKQEFIPLPLTDKPKRNLRQFRPDPSLSKSKIEKREFREGIFDKNGNQLVPTGYKNIESEQTRTDRLVEQAAKDSAKEYYRAGYEEHELNKEGVPLEEDPEGKSFDHKYEWKKIKKGGNRPTSVPKKVFIEESLNKEDK